MWTCPKCGREFARRNQEHYCGAAPGTVDEYIAAQPEESRRFLEAVRGAIRAALPDPRERISRCMPTYWKGHNIINIYRAQAHIGLHPGPEAVERFQDRLEGLKSSKGTIRIPYREPLPLELIGDIARWCDETGHHP